MYIPKMIHQLWIGPKPRPSKFMETWHSKNPDFEYILWTEEEIKKRGLKLQCINKINEMSEINGKADIIRWEILYQYGGLFFDADSVCINSIDENIMKEQLFASYENESVRKDLISTVALGFPKNHELCSDAIKWILSNEISFEKTKMRAWQTVGPGMITRLLKNKSYLNFTIFPSYYFTPIHFRGNKYNGHAKVYAHQEWGSTKKNYDIMNSLEIPQILKTPNLTNNWISLMIFHKNCDNFNIDDCLDSIKHQNGYFGIEVIWINYEKDYIYESNNNNNENMLKDKLSKFKHSSQFINVKYMDFDENKTISYAFKEGLKKCNYEIVFCMESSYIMRLNKIYMQILFMKQNPDYILCGTNIIYLMKEKMENNKNKKIFGGETKFPKLISYSEINKEKYYETLDFSTFCFKKSVSLKFGIYEIESNDEDNIDSSSYMPIELKILEKYRKIYNIQAPLVYKN